MNYLKYQTEKRVLKKTEMEKEKDLKEGAGDKLPNVWAHESVRPGNQARWWCDSLTEMTTARLDSMGWL